MWVERTVASIRTKLLENREKREELYIDKTIYTNWNSLMVSALCDYFKIFDDKSAKKMAEKTLKRLLRENYEEGELYQRKGEEGLLEIRLKSTQDTPTQSANSLASYTLILLGTITGDKLLTSLDHLSLSSTHT
ncbi:MAG: hypothetical protein ACK401_02465 [Archaeoglobaceae archaeon]